MYCFEDEARNKFFRSKHSRLYPVFLKLHRTILRFGGDVSPYLSTVYIRYNSQRDIFAVLYVRSGGFLELGLSLTTAIQSDRLTDAKKLGWKQVTKSLKVETEEDVDEEALEWLMTAYQQS